jgi:flagellar biogenesis protein FliO
VSLWFQILAMVALYGGLFYLWYAVKSQKGIGAWLSKQKATKEIKVLETQGIAQRTSVVLVEVRGNPLVIVLSPHGIHVHPLQNAENFEENLDLLIKKKPELSEVKKN